MEKKQILAELGDIPERVYDELVVEAFEQGRRQVAEIQKRCAGKDLACAAAVAHSIKGCFANLRLPEISDAAREVESALRCKTAAKELPVLLAVLGGMFSSRRKA
ncbi:MAG: Hpt domain-containing protein [Elusimicrobia bacterium]|nr:Hpt domain-containing protein [Elusimicrobiota bacterium]